MIRILIINKDYTFTEYNNFERVDSNKVLWYWMDFCQPTPEETHLLSSYFKFHHLAIEDCGQSLNKPKIDFYENYNFLLLNYLKDKSISIGEIGMFVNKGYIVTYHIEKSSAVNNAWDRIAQCPNQWSKGPSFIAHQIVDKVVDEFFPEVNNVEERLDILDNNNENKKNHELIDEVFKIRKDLLKLRKVVNSTRDLVYRILNSEHIHGFDEHNMYFSDIYDHLLKLTEMIESSREMTADIRDSYLSLDSAHMNRNMMVLTVITTIFIPLTFIAGIYGMNFQHMPELNTRYGYFIVLIVMIIMGIAMYLWFKIKGWFDN